MLAPPPSNPVPTPVLVQPPSNPVPTPVLVQPPSNPIPTPVPVPPPSNPPTVENFLDDPAIAQELVNLAAILQNPTPTNTNLSPSSGAPTTSESNTSILSGTEIIRASVNTALKTGNIERATILIDRLFSEQFQQYLSPNNLSRELLSISELQKRLQDIEKATSTKPVIIYVLARAEQLDLILIPPNGELIYRSVPDAPRENVLAEARNFRNELTNPIRRSENSYFQTAQQLYNWIIAPLAADLQRLEIDTLVFSLDGGLRSLPVAALHDGQQFLVENYSMALIPSVNLVDTTYQSLKNARLLAMGASEFEELPPLPAVPVEVSTITSEWEGAAFLNKAFTLENLKLQRAQFPYPIIHLATHGEFQPGAIDNSYIQLWDDKLRLDDLRQLGWNNPPVVLLVLSACQTALGDEQAELGFGGLAVQAGVKSALASLWYVSDEGTLALMANFYNYLDNVPIKAEALRQAQIAMLKGEVRIEDGVLVVTGVPGGIPLPPELSYIGNRILSHPYYWSAFTTIGSPW